MGSMTSSVSGKARIALPIAACWERLRDLERARDYVPGLKGAEITTEQKEGVGASRVVSHAQFGSMNETVVEWNEGEGFLIRLHRGDRAAFPFSEATFRYALREVGDETEISTTMTYALRFGVLGRLLDHAILGRVMQRSVSEVALALAENYETDAPVSPGRLRELRAAGG
jgi:carbon monoxide dehydrogenase subunit G